MTSFYPDILDIDESHKGYVDLLDLILILFKLYGELECEDKDRDRVRRESERE